MGQKEIHYFVSAHTAKGYRSFLQNNIEDAEKLIVLGGGGSKAGILARVAAAVSASGQGAEYMHCPGGPDELCGIRLFDGPAVISGNEPWDIPQDAIFIDFDEALDIEGIERRSVTINRLFEESEKLYRAAYAMFAEALAIHDEWESIYIKNLDPVKADNAAEELCGRVFDGGTGEGAFERHRFIGSATPKGTLNFVESISAELERRIFIKGRPGTGKSTIMKRVLARAAQLGHPAEVYHCGFDPDSLDAVILRGLGICVFDSTEPHEFFPSREGDEVFDTYERAITIGTDDKNREKLVNIKARYRDKVLGGSALLEKGFELATAAYDIYEKETDPAKENRLFARVLAELGI